jgi:hypothetical protein
MRRRRTVAADEARLNVTTFRQNIAERAAAGMLAALQFSSPDVAFLVTSQEAVTDVINS